MGNREDGADLEDNDVEVRATIRGVVSRSTTLY
jgi:hypothetical protein